VSFLYRFYSSVLLNHVRKDIMEHKKLNPHLYQSLKKAMYKPAGFFKGILIPFCEAGNGSLREATILASVVSKVSIPMLHASAALLQLAELTPSGANSICIRTLIDKKYSLPYRVVDGLVNYFEQCGEDPRELFTLWHQSLLVLAQRYKNELSRAQKERLLLLIKKKHHPFISAEIVRELHSSTDRQEDILV
jgi:essential nuclear protein 1